MVADDARIGYPPGTRLGRAHLGPVGVPDRRPARQAPAVHRRPDQRPRGARLGAGRGGAPAAELDERFEALLERIALTPVNQLVMMKLLVNQALYAQGLHATQALGVRLRRRSPGTPRRATRSSSARPSRAGARPSGSGTRRTTATCPYAAPAPGAGSAARTASPHGVSAPRRPRSSCWRPYQRHTKPIAPDPSLVAHPVRHEVEEAGHPGREGPNAGAGAAADLVHDHRALERCDPPRRGARPPRSRSVKATLTFA